MKIKRIKITILVAFLVISSLFITVYAAKGVEYSDTFSTSSSVQTPNHLYGYHNIAAQLDQLWSNNGTQSFTIELFVKDDFNNTYSGKGARSFNTATSGNVAKWRNAHSNNISAKSCRFLVKRTGSGSATIGGKLVSWSYTE